MSDPSSTNPAARGRADELFPLKLVPFEIFNLLDDSEAYPKTFVVRLTCRGEVDRSCLETAWNLALARHPLLRAVVQRRRARAPVWIAAPTSVEVEWLDSIEKLDDGLGGPIHLELEPGARLGVLSGGDSTEMSFRFHHACCDGLGAFGFIEDVLAIYAASRAGPGRSFALRPLDTARLRQRGVFEIPPRSPWQQLADLWRGIRGNWRWYRDEPQPVRPSGAGGPPVGGSEPRPAFVFHDLQDEPFHRLRQRAHESSATLNDLLLTELFLFLADWTSRSEAVRRLSILMPANLRVRDDQALPAANVMGFSFLTRGRLRLEHAGRLLADVREETQRIRNYRLSLFFLGMIGFLSCCPPLLAGLVRGEHCFATAVLTNLGDPTRRFFTRFPRRDGLLVAGNLMLERISGVPPLRPLTSVVLSAVTYGGKLTLSLQADPHFFSAGETRQMLAEFTARLGMSDAAAAPAARAGVPSEDRAPASTLPLHKSFAPQRRGERREDGFS